ncbi:hypothetical protein [Paraburkholderia caledonica]|jgi:DNA-binding XRE family transcriptional regulator|uniref:hypothetical protein n=1 Tax=Paraburkholderia caledonica TaxID=134536 RepID=UPI0012EC1895|nr:hypothetical protein [Paraburkholderia caledonica]
MIYASERDAKLGWTIGSNAMWRQSGATSVRQVTAESVDCGTAVPTIVIGLSDLWQYLGTSVNTAVPLPFKLGSSQRQSEPKLTTPAEMVEELREAFGLNVTQLAQVLHIERITVYAWLRTERMEKLNLSNRNRLWRLYQLAKQWGSYAPLAGKYLVEPVPERTRRFYRYSAHRSWILASSRRYMSCWREPPARLRVPNDIALSSTSH